MKKSRYEAPIGGGRHDVKRRLRKVTVQPREMQSDLPSEAEDGRDEKTSGPSSDQSSRQALLTAYERAISILGLSNPPTFEEVINARLSFLKARPRRANSSVQHVRPSEPSARAKFTAPHFLLCLITGRRRSELLLGDFPLSHAANVMTHHYKIDLKR